MSLLVTPAWLADHLNDPDLVVIDSSYYLPIEGKNALSEFETARIPGAVFFDIDAVADPAESNLPHMVPTAAAFARQVGALGVGNRSHVVCYDQKGIFSAPRCWWLFSLFGHDKVSVLDGGLPKWRQEGHPVEAGTRALPTLRDFRPSFRAGRLYGIGDVIENLDSARSLIVDARAAGRFTGSAAEPRAGLPSGHIPGSCNLPFMDLLNDDQTMKSREALRELFSAVGVTDGRSVVTSCGSGISAAVLSFGLALAGFDPGALYDGSWTEWASREDTPKATAPENTSN